MANIATLTISVVANTKTATKNVNGLVTAAGKADKGVNRSLTGISNGLKNMAKVAAVSTLAVGVAFGGLVKSSIDSASDLSESQNKVIVVFEDSAQSVLDFSKTTASALGISQSAALEAAGVYGNLFTSLGLNEKAAAGMSTELITLSADLASFNNLAPDIVLDKLRAGLTGEVEPLKTLGISFNQATLEAKIFELGLASTKDEITESDKITARYSLILEQTAKAQGDFAATSMGLANATRRVQARFDDFRANLGQKLLPVVEPLVNNFLALAESILPKIVSIFNSKFLPVVIKASEFMGKLGMAFSLFTNGSIRQGVTQAVGAFGLFDKFSAEDIRAPLQTVISLFEGDFPSAAEFAKEALLGFLDNIKEFAKEKFDLAVTWVIDDLIPLAMETFGKAVVVSQQLFSLAATWVINDLIPLAQEKFTLLLAWIDEKKLEIKIAIQEIDPATIDALRPIAGIILGIAAAFIFYKTAMTGIALGQALIAIASGAALAISPLLLLSAAVGVLVFVIVQFGEDAKVALINLIGLFELQFPRLSQMFTDFGNSILNIDWANIGSNIINGIKSGLEMRIPALKQSFIDAGANMLSGIKGFLGINSPSMLLFKEVGVPAGQGIEMGLQSHMAGFDSTMNTAISGATQGGQPQSGGGGMTLQSGAIVVNNAVPETGSQSVDKSLRNLSFLGGTT